MTDYIYGIVRGEPTFTDRIVGTAGPIKEFRRWVDDRYSKYSKLTLSAGCYEVLTRAGWERRKPRHFGYSNLYEIKHDEFGYFDGRCERDGITLQNKPLVVDYETAFWMLGFEYGEPIPEFAEFNRRYRQRAARLHPDAPNGDKVAFQNNERLADLCRAVYAEREMPKPKRVRKRPDYPNRDCVVCGKSYSPASWNAKYCGDDCRKSARATVGAN